MSPIVPLERFERRFPLEGVVTGHNIVADQTWRRVARGNLPNIAIRLDVYQHYYLNASVCALPVHHKFGAVMPELPEIISVPLPEVAHNEYRTGDRVEVVIGYVPVVHQHVQHARPLEVIECSVTDRFLQVVPKMA